MKTIDLFTIPLFQFNIESTKKLIPELTKCAYHLECEDTGFGGESTPYVTMKDVPLYKELVDLLFPSIKQAIETQFYNPKLQIKINDSCWFNVLRKGQFLNTHLHPNSDWTCVYYIKSDEKSGIGFKNPDSFQVQSDYKSLKFNQYNSSARVIYPKTNDFFITPSHIEHWVEPNNTDIPRISVAFNIEIIDVYNDIKSLLRDQHEHN